MTAALTADQETSIWYGKVALMLLAQFGKPASYLDFCCGDGVTVQAMRDARVRPSIGIAPTKGDRDTGQCPNHVLVRDLGRPFRLNDVYGLVTALRPVPVPDDRLWVVASSLAQHCEYRLVVADDRLGEFFRREGFRQEDGESERITRAVRTLGTPAPDWDGFFCYVRPSLRISVRGDGMGG